MTSSSRFGSLTPVPLREAWAHEAHAFTPWLIDNIDQLADAVGIPLEVLRTEATIDGFQADILARNGADGSFVIIENQLQSSDNVHLGQLLTYFAGHKARTAIWIAADFKDAHLSVLRWANASAGAPFAFFAVRLNVVRIGASPFAPPTR